MKFLIIIYFIFSFSISSAQPISDVQIKNNWIIVYNEKSKEISRMALAKNVIVGTSGNFFVVIANGWIITFNEKCKEIARIPSSNKQVKGAIGETFTVISNSWIISYDKNCKEKSRRPK